MAVIAVPYMHLVNAGIVLPEENGEYLKVDKHFFQFCLRPVLEQIDIDEDWYTAKYPDVLAAIAQGSVASGAMHYVQYGYFENRIPYQIEVDEPWYLDQYPDVKSAMDQKMFTTAQEHFEIAGFAEGRLPYAGFVLATVSRPRRGI